MPCEGELDSGVELSGGGTGRSFASSRISGARGGRMFASAEVVRSRSAHGHGRGGERLRVSSLNIRWRTDEGAS